MDRRQVTSNKEQWAKDKGQQIRLNGEWRKDKG